MRLQCVSLRKGANVDRAPLAAGVTRPVETRVGSTRSRSPSSPASVLLLAAFLLMGLVLLHACRAQAHAGRMFSTAQWLEDLDFVVSQLKAHHPHLYDRISPPDFDALVAASRAEIRRAGSDEAAYFAIRRTIAGIQDGHTQLLDNGAFRIADRRFPFRLDRFTDGVFITVIAQPYQSALGARVTAVNGTPIDTVLAIVASTDGVDTPLEGARASLTGITFARVLYGLDVSDINSSWCSSPGHDDAEA